MNKPQRIDQFLPSYAERDAIGLHVTKTRELLLAAGFESEIFIEIEHPTTVGKAKNYKAYSHWNDKTAAILYHFSTGSVLTHVLHDKTNFISVYFHNITPPALFDRKTQAEAFLSCQQGYHQIPIVSSFCQDLWVPSLFNAKTLEPHRFPKPSLVPILRDYEKLKREAEKLPARMRKPEEKNILFVGRVIPSKGVHDLFFLLKLLKNKGIRAKLDVVGQDTDVYAQVVLPKIAKELGLKLLRRGNVKSVDADIHLTGPVNDMQLARYYRDADLFACMSDHEGFCVPLVEAMAFGLPIVAHDAAAVGETLGSGGILVHKENWAMLLSRVEEVLLDSAVSHRLREKASQEHKKRFSNEALEVAFKNALRFGICKPL